MKCRNCLKESETYPICDECENIKTILNRCVYLLDEQQKVELFEFFNGGTFDENSFNDWINDYIYEEIIQDF